MTNHFKRTATLVLASLLTVAAHAFPDRPVRLVVGFAPGGADISGRLIARHITAGHGGQ